MEQNVVDTLEWNEVEFRNIVQHFFSAHEMPIHVGNDGFPANDGVACWGAEPKDVRNQIRDWLKSRHMDEDHLPRSSFYCYPIRPQDGISGCLWFNPYGADHVYLFARRVFADYGTDLYPSPHRFLTIVVNDDKAVLDIRKRAAARVETEEGRGRVHDIQAVIDHAVIDYVRWLCNQYVAASHEQQGAIRELGRRHGQALLAYLLNDADKNKRRLAAKALSWIPVPLLTSDEAKPLPECKSDEGVIWYVDDTSNLADRGLIKQHPVVDAREPNIRAMLRILENEENVRTNRVPDPTTELVHPLTEEEVRQQGLAGFLTACGSCWSGPVCMARFDKELGEALLHVSIPSLTLSDEEVRDALHGTVFEDMPIQFQRSHLLRRLHEGDYNAPRTNPRLAINVENDAILELAKLTAGSESITGAARHLAYFAEHLSSKRMTRQQLVAHSSAFKNLLLGLKEMYGGAMPPEREDVEERERRDRWLELKNADVVAVVYSDLVRSSQLLSNLGRTKWDQVLDLYCETAVNAIWRHGGAFDCFTGDGFIAMFPCDKTGVSLTALKAVRAIIGELRELFTTGEMRKMLSSEHVKATGMSRYAITAGSIMIRKLGGRMTGTGVTMVEGARLVGDKALFDDDGNCVIMAESYVDADGAVGAVELVTQCSSPNFRDGKYVYPDYVGVRHDRLYRPLL
ncbi:MAG: adenylate/guanylate cyclase domain-containing protein [Chloroflexi bacterium]|nr:adenylate/guanylate cyclase domain-containing protein [Chloroflexota bacterium]